MRRLSAGPVTSVPTAKFPAGHGCGGGPGEVVACAVVLATTNAIGTR
ncbi:hypothetical protein JQU17_19635 [Ponticoccus sp. SC2-23]|nr:hypothetical protein [Alexandriicola marinus]MBM1220656.1 hypothetical protein [Ponticoccus sp. SC6-9]MBM1225915.1 hypothetical protein [Ponticoccus sp. SC6-15]MBM1231212.1 hypothetical protein [Ponticoccus sp. SC6-38]MBM1235927.1 hypothetical protein [Ponticoccus sp. SC6-45]MBM1240234.1 hypothetical protein [Ponticoccus sp. SC6-49]MBM1244769.1 hypothetical protein [Ponticoccus sp. SC2-64]MBM1249401.1 hypothetical protein [Ponticoccus sp. SC6-42]MBM1252310.1 hypothetical protein [Pontico